MTKPRIKHFVASVWHCSSPEFIGTGFSPKEAYVAWVAYMERYGYL